MNFYQYYGTGGGGGGGIVEQTGAWVVTSTFANKVWITGTVHVDNPGGGGGGGTVEQTASWVVTDAGTGLNVNAAQAGAWNIGTVASITNVVNVSARQTASWVVSDGGVALSVDGLVGVTGAVAITSGVITTITNPVVITATVANPAYVTSTTTSPVNVTGVVTVSQTGTWVTTPGGVQTITSTVGNPVYVSSTTTNPVNVTGTVTLGLTSSLSITGSTTVAQTGTWVITGSTTIATTGTLTVSQSNPVLTSSVTATLTNPVTVYVANSGSSSAAWVTGSVTINNPGGTGGGTVDQTASWVVTGTVTLGLTSSLPVVAAGLVGVTGAVAITSGVITTITNPVNTVPLTPNPTQFYPVRLTDGTSYYVATGGGGGGGGNTVLVPPINNPNTASLTVINQVITIATLLGANSNRVGYTIFNDSSATLYIFYGTNNVANSQSIQIASRQVYESADNVFVGNIYGQWTSAGSGLARVTEYTNTYGVTGTIVVNQGTGALPDTLTPWQVTFPQYNMDAFGGTRVSPPYTLYDMSNKYGIDTRELSVSGSSSGGVTSDPNNSAAILTVSGTSGSYARMRTNTWFRYQAGRGQRILQTIVNADAGKVGQIRRWGYYDDGDGLFWQLSGTSFGFVRRTSTSGAPVETFISQSAFNIDKVDGTGQSGLNIDFTKGNIYEMQFQWLGVGNVELYVNGTPCHIIRNPNQLANPYMKTAVLPLSWEVQNMVASTGSSMMAICANVTSEGGNKPPEVSYGAYAITGTAIGNGAAAEAPVLAIRLTSSFNGLDNRVVVLPRAVHMSTTTRAAFFRIIMNPTTLTGGTWQPADATSAVEFNSGSTSFTGGQHIARGYVLNPGSADIDLTELFHEQSRKLRRDAFTGVSDTFLIVAWGDGGTGVVLPSITWEEIK